MNKIFVYLFCIFFISCNDLNEGYDNARTFDYNDFKQIEQLKGKLMSFDDEIMQPSEIHVLDSMLFLVENMDNKLIHIYNLNSKTKFSTRISRGQGPKDMFLPIILSIGKDSIQIADMMLSTVRNYNKNDFIYGDEPSFLSEIKLEKRMCVDAALLNDKIWAYLYTDNYIISEFNLIDGKQTARGLAYPNISIPYTDVERRDAFYMNVASNGMDRLTVSYCMTDLLEFYDEDGVLKNRLHGPEQFYSYCREYRDGKVISTKMDTEKNREAYFSPCWVDDYFFVLFDGEHINAPNHDSNSNWLFVFSKDGEPEIAFQLDIPLFRFCVDPKLRKIYGISINPEYQLVEYSY